MCGIIAVFEKKGRPLNVDLFQKSLSLIKHRGPDNHSYKCFGNIGLGHTRLSILDLSEDSNQPVFNDQFVLVFNGEIYNFRELARKYQLSEKAFRSDTLFLLEYLALGKSFGELRGMFAFAFYDKKTGALSLVRDQLGIKPIYYLETENSIIFSSEIKPLLCYASMKVEINYAALSDHIVLGYSQLNETLFKYIYRVPEGSHVLVTEDSVKFEKYFDLTHSFVNHQDSDDLVREVLGSHLVSDVPVGMMLSGGVDSSLMASIYSLSLERRDIKCYNAGDTNSSLNSLVSERQTALTLSEKLGLDLIKIPVNSRSLIGLKEYVTYSEEPIANSGALLLGKICQLAETKVILSGHGGDEAYAGYRRHVIAHLYDKYRMLLKLMPIRGLFTLTKKRLSSDIRRAIASLAFPDELEFTLSAVGLKSVQDSWINDGIVDMANTSQRFYVDVNKNEKSKLKRLQYKEYSGYLSSQNLIVADKLSMAYSKELRVPFVYPEIAKHGLDKKAKELFYRNKGKQPLRQMLKLLGGSEVLKNKKMGFSPDIKSILNDPTTVDLLTGRATASRGIVNTEMMKDLIANLDKLSSEDLNQLFNLAVIESWMRVFIDD